MLLLFMTMPFKKPKFKDLFLIVIVLVLIFPQTRKPIQVLLNKGFALISPSVLSEEKQKEVTSYNWQLKDNQGILFNFEETKGKVVLINFWATWCPPCIAEMPSLQKLYNDYNDKIVFLFVTDDWFKETNSFLEKNDYTFKVYRPDSKHEIFKIKTIPRTFLIDKKGKIIIDKTGASNWNSDTVRKTIDELIKIKS
ncbi:TlpA family protein disulfide reductase [Seonamhaeicola sp. MEBiC1930]|uniref:TlpA family protein disulfide reductase n=1 Tax=Seonamhaeicola sp. MEBiC01930 TaxID=2976768 RepID=UPI003249EFC1